MELHDVLEHSVLRYRKDKAWGALILFAAISALVSASVAGGIVSCGLKEAVKQTQYHEQQIRDLTAESQKWSMEAGKCAASAIVKKGQGF